jgi:RNA polymerase sigma-70 factor (ECF subfamily)
VRKKETNEGGAETEVDIADSSALPDEAVMDKEQAQLLARNIEALPLLQRTIILLFHQEELSLEEIAVITSLPVNTVKSHLFRARKTLKTKIGNS